MFTHNFSAYESSDTLSRHAGLKSTIKALVLQGVNEIKTRAPQIINVQGAGTMLIAPAIHPFNRDKMRNQKLKAFARDYRTLKVRDLVSTL
jgi:hypothetical protein